MRVATSTMSWNCANSLSRVVEMGVATIWFVAIGDAIIIKGFTGHDGFSLEHDNFFLQEHVIVRKRGAIVKG